MFFSFPFVSAAPAYSSVNTSMTVFFVLVGFGFLFAFLGVASESSLVAILGFIILIIASFLMLNGNVMVPSGYTENVTGDVTVVTRDYVAWDDGNNELVGFLMLFALTALAFTFIDRGGG